MNPVSDIRCPISGNVCPELRFIDKNYYPDPSATLDADVDLLQLHKDIHEGNLQATDIRNAAYQAKGLCFETESACGVIAMRTMEYSVVPVTVRKILNIFKPSRYTATN